MTALPASVIVVSRGRPTALARCLTGLSQLDYTPFEIVVVADATGLAALEGAGLAGLVKTVRFDRANISAARNLGLAQAAGEVVAFIDDDAVPEPTWLCHLAAVFADEDVAAAGGYVRGRNGISFQSRACRLDAAGRPTEVTLPGDAPQIFDTRPGAAIKTEGTNCAFRRDLLLRLGGFDPAFRFYMDETDLNLRLADSGLKTAVVPLAQVHHGFAASERREASRLPRTLFDVGASSMLLLRKRVPPGEHAAHLAALGDEQRQRLLRHMVNGTCEPGAVPRLLATLAEGIAAGRARPLDALTPIAASDAPFRPFQPPVPRTGAVALCGRSWSTRRLRREARARVAKGGRVSLFLFSPTTLYHRVRFDPGGFWEQRGGLFGKADRSDPPFRPRSFHARCRAEIARVSTVRGLSKVESVN